MGEPGNDPSWGSAGDDGDGLNDVLSGLAVGRPDWFTSASQRDRAGEDRDRAASERDELAASRDDNAGVREDAALERESYAAAIAEDAYRRLNAAQLADGLRWLRAGTPERRAEGGGARPGSGDKSSPSDRVFDGEDRIAELVEKGIDRDHTRADLQDIAQLLRAAATERRAAAADRAAAAADRAIAAADRDAARTERQQAAIDRAQDDTGYIT